MGKLARSALHPSIGELSHRTRYWTLLPAIADSSRVDMLPSFYLFMLLLFNLSNPGQAEPPAAAGRDAGPCGRAPSKVPPHLLRH